MAGRGEIAFKTLLKLVLYSVTAYYAVPFFLKISVRVYDNFYSTSISFNLDTLFINWNTSFPAVTVCEIYNGEKIWDISQQKFGAEHDLLLDDFVGEIVFFRGICSTCQKCESELECPRNFTALLEEYRSKCSEIIENCSYRNSRFNCCDEFLPIPTEHGLCYAFNSNQASKQPQTRYANNRETGPGQLVFDVVTDVQLHVHAPIEVPTVGIFAEGLIRETVLRGRIKEIVIKVMEVYNHPSVEPTSLEQRRCRFSYELTDWGRSLGIYEFYSFSSCIVECTMGIHLDWCNCSNHFLAGGIKDKAIPLCDYQGLNCLSENFESIEEERKTCDCMSSCEEPEYNIVYNSADDETNYSAEKSRIRLSMVELPTERYVRLVTKNHLDLIISVGGVAGLFFNASVIRVVEIIFLLLECKWGKYFTWVQFRMCRQRQ